MNSPKFISIVVRPHLPNPLLLVAGGETLREVETAALTAYSGVAQLTPADVEPPMWDTYVRVRDVIRPDAETLAGVLYTRYCEAVGGKAFNGDPLPSWAEFRADPAKQKQALAWIAAAEAANG